jgi:hypothetical protein
VLAPNAPQGDTRERRPVFSWTAAPGTTDSLVLMNGAGEAQLYVDQDGAYVLEERIADDEEYVEDADDYYDDDESSEESVERYRRRDLRGAAAWRQDGDQVSVAMTEALPPGRYTWTVVRDRADGERAEAPTYAMRILGPPLTRLSVRASSRAGARSTRPGRTLLRVTATAWAHVRISLRRSGRERVMRFRWNASPTRSLRVDWSCRLPGGRYRYRVVATDDDGRRLTRTGSFSTVTRSRCKAMRRRESRALQQRVKARIRREQAAARRQQAAERRQLQRSIANCHAFYGVVRKVWLDDGTTTLYCVSPYGAWPI